MTTKSDVVQTGVIKIATPQPKPIREPVTVGGK